MSNNASKPAKSPPVLEEKEEASVDKSEEEKQLESIYSGISGFGIPVDEEAHIRACNSAPTYGEIVYASIEKVIDILNLQKEDIFYDLGSGVGKVVMQVCMTTPVEKAIGVELSATRFNKSIEALSRFQALDPLRSVHCQYLHKDFSEVNLEAATAIFMCSTCYPNELLVVLADKFSKLKPGTRIASLKALPQHDKLHCSKIVNLKMTWSESSSVHFYEVI